MTTAESINSANAKTEFFLKEAFCIDGECKFVKPVDVDGMMSLQFVLIDSDRGTFYVTISK